MYLHYAKENSVCTYFRFYKDGLEPLVKELSRLGITIYSTGGTQKFIEDLGIGCVPVENLTTYPSILGGA